ncbi:carbon-monoxide dehydrogenase medium subunit/2-furoyl-CoA dehydrogenase FAD binding subunit [Brevibacillus aydinogluensis]|jgi:2-furoyl-CoA dehydrogenase FAD binding subunit|uniref:FAD binding domain-containing protein n=1 Tax=Brevibacillus aydinogluensis TaxID=927786 RepID=UPI0028935176|nr:xanthine dehydrogenase family protein subunit M [Brevibacillus aydinogluensis]MDT3415047.1 carbon-monoxide dehydrogenase medium subunit/2-furoyl-CoA dehydrogenase FAD binding subunit [Brevibacillus aydinogluensis]
MKPASFNYYRPSTLEETLQLLLDCGDEGKLIAGGQSLIPILNMRLSSLEHVIDINGLQELDYIRMEEGILKIGGLCRQRSLEKSPTVKEVAPLLSEAVPFIGHVQTRNRGTVGGSLVHADPTAEIPLSLLALNATAIIQSAEETREVPVEDFFITYLTTDIASTEMLTEIQIPVDALPKGYAFVEFSRRHGDFALVAVASLLDTDEDGTITAGRIAIGGVDAVPMLAHDAMDVLLGEKLTDALLEEAGNIAAENTDPESDLHASREYRQHLAKVFTKRAIRKAYERSQHKLGGGRNHDSGSQT